VSALEFLLEKGFSPEMGARPLKRAIDQYVLAPLAATIVEHRIPEGDQFLFVRSDGQSIQAEFVDPDADAEGPQIGANQTVEQLSLAAMILQAEGTNAERLALDTAGTETGRLLGSAEWEQLKERLNEELGQPEFWSRPDRQKVLARIALMDRVKAASQTANSLRDRLAKSKGKAGYSRELVMRLAQQLHVIREGIKDALDDAPIEVVLQIEPALDSAIPEKASVAWCEELTKMYRGWASKRGMQISAVGTNSSRAAPILLISGFGAYRALEPETGLHVHESDDEGANRVVARVRVAPAPPGDIPSAAAFEIANRALNAIPRSGTVVRRYRGGRSPLVRDAKRGWRSGKLESVLEGNFDLIGAV
jgi:ATP-dependent Clp protease ATP-binding subunit ClpC